MAKRRVEVYLTDEELKFLEWLADLDSSEDDTNWTVSKEISTLAELKIRETMENYKRGAVINELI